MKYKKAVIVLLLAIITLITSANLMLLYLCLTGEKDIERQEATPYQYTTMVVRNSENISGDNVLALDTAEKAEPIIELVEEIEPEYKVSISPEDVDLIAKLLYLEGRGESEECQKAIVSVIINRLNSGYWGNTYRDVIYAKNQFEPAKYIENTIATPKQYDVIYDIMKNGISIPGYVLYFRAKYFFDWCINYKQIDNTCFSYTQKDFNKLGGK